MSKLIVTEALVDEFDNALDAAMETLCAMNEDNTEATVLSGVGDHPDAGLRVMSFALWYSTKYGVPA